MLLDPQPGQRCRANKDIRSTEPPLDVMARKGEELEVAHLMRAGRVAVLAPGEEWAFACDPEELDPLPEEAGDADR